MSRSISYAIRALDAATARLYLSLARERPGLVTVLFHSLFADADEMRLNQLDPQQAVTVADFVAVVECFQRAGYRFVAPTDVLNGLDPSGRHVMLTFDDGYWNNLRAMPTIKRCGVPVTFFISTGHVRQGRCFWWDVLYREQTARGVSVTDISNECAELKRLPYHQIEEELVRRFGAAASAPRGDVDRPMTVQELRELAREPLVSLGNHTRDHAILTRCDAHQVDEQIEGAQDDLREMTGTAPSMIAYPNGDTSACVVAAARRAGLRLGITIHPAKNDLPIAPDGDAAMRLSRFTPLGGPDIDAQCRMFRSDVSLLGAIKRVAARD